MASDLSKFGGFEAPDCAACPFSQAGAPRHRPVLATLPPVRSCLGVLVGEGPGEVEVSTGRPFTGPTGAELDRELAEVGLPRASLAVANATACIPPLGLRTQSALVRAARACRPLFESQLAPYRHLPALSCGAAAGLAWSGKKRAIQGGKHVSRGFIRPRLEGAPWLLTWHPTYAIWKDRWHLGEFRADLARFARVIRGETEPAPLWIPATDRNLKSVVEECLDLKCAVGLDIETGPGRGLPEYTGKDPLRAALKTVGFGSPTRGLSFLASEVTTRPRALLVSATPKVWHNGIYFDGPCLARHGFEVASVSDTREKRYVLAPESKLSLAYLASLMTDFPPWKETEGGEGEDGSGKGHAKWESKDLDALREYNAYDCVVTARVNVALERDLAGAD